MKNIIKKKLKIESKEKCEPVKEVEEKIFVTPQNNPRMKSLLNHNNLKTSTPLLHPSTILPGMKAPKSCPPAIECTKEESCEVGESPYGEISGITNAYGSYIKHEITTGLYFICCY